MGIEGKIGDRIALVCDSSFAKAFDERGRSVFPPILIESLSRQFKFEVLGQLEMMPVVFIRADSRELSCMDSYLEETFGKKVAIEGDGEIVTDITFSPTSP